jgi:uncharacterized protein (DUF2236 family)
MTLFRLVPPLAPGLAGDRGTTGPDSMVWLVARERAVTLGGLSALLLQVAHPLVAAGVAEHSTFQTEPLHRLRRTLELLLVTTFGDQQQATEMANSVRQVHRSIRGTTSHSAGRWQAGTHYSAMNPELCMWVYATLVELSLDSFDVFVRTLTFDERARYYYESETFGRLLGVTSQVRPGTYYEFRDYYQRMLHQLVVDEQALGISQSVLSSKLYRIPLSTLGRVIAAGLLPASTRAAYGLRWDRTDRAFWWICRHGVRFMTRRLAPAPLRYWQHYHMAIQRCAQA